MLAIRHIRNAQIDLEAAMLRDDIGRRAAVDAPDGCRDAPPVIGERLDGENLPRSLADGAAPILMAGAGMRRPALDMHIEAADALARRDDPAAIARRLGHQDKGGAPALSLGPRLSGE